MELRYTGRRGKESVENTKTFETVKSVIDEWDPEGLLRFGARADEYDSESRSIAACVPESSEEILARHIAGIMNYSFCTSFARIQGVEINEADLYHMHYTSENCLAIAKRIKERVK